MNSGLPGTGMPAAPGRPPFPYDGLETLRQPILDALRRVVDPEVAMTIVDVGLIYGVTVAEGKVHVVLTMTSAACPVTGLIMEEVETELDRAVPPEWLIEVQLVWEPPWTPERMSERSRRFMGW
ncbi:MAG: iron-sulfur cluster assembly protein [Polaromonas sp.]